MLKFVVYRPTLNDGTLNIEISTKIQGKLTYQRIKTSADWPKLKCKAAATRHLSHYALYLATTYNDHSIHAERRKGVATKLVRFYTICETEGRFLSAAARAEMVVLSRDFMAMYAHLSAEALAQQVRLWKMVPKFHIWQHLCEDQTLMNPRYFWTYSDEDFQRIMKGIATSCHANNLAPMVLMKWLVVTFECA